MIHVRCRRGVVLMALLSTCAGASARQPSSAESRAPKTDDHAAQAGDLDRSTITPVAHVEVRGDGPIPMVLIPDVGYDWSVFESFMERNSERYTMYAVTLPGNAGTEPPPFDEDAQYQDLNLLRNSADAIRLMIRDRHLNKPVLVGHGSGGHLAVWVAVRHPESTRAAISIDGMPVTQIGAQQMGMTPEERMDYIENKLIRPFTHLTLEQWNTHWRRMMLNNVTDPDRAEELAELFLSTPRGIVLETSVEQLFSDLTEDLQTSKVPVLFIGPSEPELPLGMTVLRWKTILGDSPANTTLKIFPDCRHFVMDDDPWQLDEVVDDFLMGRRMENTLVSPGAVSPINPELEDTPEARP